MKNFIRLTVVIVSACIARQASAQTIDVAGIWLTEAKTGQVEISDCGDGTPCSTLIWISDERPKDETALTPMEDRKDSNNPDRVLAKRSLIGLMLLKGFERRKMKWRSGSVYDPESGKTYGSRLKLLEDGRLQVKGCIGPICKTQIWTRV